MPNLTDSRAVWRFLDGSVSVSLSMWLAIAITQCAFCSEWPAIGFLSRLATDGTGIIIVATALLFPTTAALYGGAVMILAAKETVERWSRSKDEKAMAKGREEGLKEGREEERQRIIALLKERGVEIPSEIANNLSGEGASE